MFKFSNRIFLSEGKLIAEVIVDVMSSEVDRVFDYEIPSSLADITKGYRVSVPFGNRKIEGYIVNIKKNTDCPKDKLKCIIKSCFKYLPGIHAENIFRRKIKYTG